MFVVYHIESTMEDRKYKRQHDAVKRVNKLNTIWKGPKFAYATEEVYNTQVVHLVERTNLMSGKKYMEPSNTPHYLSPSSETYWSS